MNVWYLGTKFTDQSIDKLVVDSKVAFWWRWAKDGKEFQVDNANRVEPGDLVAITNETRVFAIGKADSKVCLLREILAENSHNKELENYANDAFAFKMSECYILDKEEVFKYDGGGGKTRFFRIRDDKKTCERIKDLYEKKWERMSYESFCEHLIRCKNVVFHGAPGTGKTHLAKEIAKKMIFGDEAQKLPEEFDAWDPNEQKKWRKQFRLVQFHQSYDYTDFVEGLRPVRRERAADQNDAIDENDKTGIGFKPMDGVFKKFCEEALNSWNDASEPKKDNAKKFIFVIDEINRGEMSKIFGELFFAIDPGYRGTKGKIKTQYANLQRRPNVFDIALEIKDIGEDGDYGHFFVPENVYIIGTMNDIDRSVESMDFAMRRRFAFKEITAESRSVMIDEEIKSKYVNAAKRRMKSLNMGIEAVGLTKAYHIGPSYFLKLESCHNNFNWLWRFHLEGVLREYLRGAENEKHDFDKLREAYCQDDKENSPHVNEMHKDVMDSFKEYLEGCTANDDIRKIVSSSTFEYADDQAVLREWLEFDDDDLTRKKEILEQIRNAMNRDRAPNINWLKHTDQSNTKKRVEALEKYKQNTPDDGIVASWCAHRDKPEEHFPLGASSRKERCGYIELADTTENALLAWCRENIYSDSRFQCKCAANQTLVYEKILGSFVPTTYKHLMELNRNLILHGAPGTGKTFLAKEIAKQLIFGQNVPEGNYDGWDDNLKDKWNNQFDFVQFHQSYDYTDFVEGMRPQNAQSKSDGIGFDRQDGIFKAFCKRALSETSERFVFIIDEINRGEMSKIFGELFFAIDPGYRGTKGEIKTQYANLQCEPNEFDKALGIENIEENKKNGEFGHFFVPENVYVIGTMNDIDRSVESMDFAIRRRFAFEEITAKQSQAMFDDDESWKNANDEKVTVSDELRTEIKNRMNKLNAAIADENICPGLGPSYQIGGAYFLKFAHYYDGTDERKAIDKAFDDLWEYHIKGVVEEYLRGTQIDIGVLKEAYDTESTGSENV